MLNKIRQLFVSRSGLLIIISAALLLELLSAAQYYYTRKLMEAELEKRVEGELRLKAVLIKSTLNKSEDLLKDFIWKLQAHLDFPDSARVTVGRMAMLGNHLQGVAIGFGPYYYPEKGKWYEPYARRSADGEVEVTDIGGPEHDYLQMDFYKKTLESEELRVKSEEFAAARHSSEKQTANNLVQGVWVDPYMDNDGAQDRVTSYFLPVKDRSGKVVAVAGVDVSIEWLRDTIDGRHIYPSSFVLLLTEAGNPIIQPEEGRVGKGAVEHVIALINDSTVSRKKSSSGRSDLITFDTDNRKGRVIFANMKGKPHWQLAIVCYDDEVFAPLNQLRLKMLLFMLLAFGILLGVISIFRRKDEKLRKKEQEQEYINKELQIASDVQQALLPQDKEELKSDSVKVEGRLIPAKAVGGDLYNAFVRDGKLFFCIGDVTGKGIPAAIIMAITQTLFRNIASRESNPARIMSELNQAACRNNKSNIFITLFIGVLDLPTGRLRYCNAGHEVPIVLSEELRMKSEELRMKNEESAAAIPSLLDVKANLPIGIFTDFSYEMQELKMGKGDTLFLYTDGLTEAKNAERKLLGREHVMALVSVSAKAMMQSLDASPTQALVDGVVEQWKQFGGDTEQSDDMTLLAVSYTPVEEHNILDETLTLSNNVKEVATLSTFIKDVMTRLNIGKPLASKLRLALEEAVVNVMEYAYPAGSSGDVNIRVTSDGKQLKFIITDSGISFDPTEASKADTTLSAEERPVGGLGILLVRELMDSINYERIDKKNVLTMKKTIKQ